MEITCPAPMVYQTAFVVWPVAFADDAHAKPPVAKRHSALPQDSQRARVLCAIRDAGESGTTQSKITRATRSLTIRERTDLLNALKLEGAVREETTPTGGRSRTVFVAC